MEEEIMGSSRAPILGIADIQEILPHRSPFLFVDRVMEWTPGERIVAERDLRPEESFFAGHFPGRPIMPGVLISEALAQASGLLLGLTWRLRGMPPGFKGPGILYLAGIEMKYLAVAQPGKTLILEAALGKAFGMLYQFEASASVGATPVARGKISLAGPGA